MFIKKVNFVVCLVVAVVLGFGASYMFKADVDEGMTSGDISKASVYSKQMPDPEATVIEEMLRNDTSFLASTQNDFSIIKERVEVLGELAERTISSCGEMPEFEDLILTIQSLQAKAYNTNLAIAEANSGLEKIVAGKSDANFEVNSNKVYIGFEKIGNQLAVGQYFVTVATEYVENNEGETADMIAGLAGEWMEYCVIDAVICDSEEKLAGWETIANEVSNTRLGSRVVGGFENLSKGGFGNFSKGGFENLSKGGFENLSKGGFGNLSKGGLEN